MSWLGLLLIGLATGALAATLGLGGGIVYVPALVVLFDFDQQLAQGTSLAVIVPTAVIGTVVHARAQRVRWDLAVPLAFGGVAGGVLGAQLALELDPTVLRRIFAAFLVATALRMLARTRRAARPPADPSGPEAGGSPTA